MLAFSTLAFQGAVAAGSAVWGTFAQRFGVGTALLYAGAGTVAMTALTLFLRLPDATVDLTSWNHWRLPAMEKDTPSIDGDLGPVLVTVEYEVAPDQAKDFLKAVRQYRRIRRRDGAQHWGIFRDTENVNSYIETFIVSSWAEHLRQHERLTRADREVEERVLRHVVVAIEGAAPDFRRIARNSIDRFADLVP